MKILTQNRMRVSRRERIAQDRFAQEMTRQEIPTRGSLGVFPGKGTSMNCTWLRFVFTWIAPLVFGSVLVVGCTSNGVAERAMRARASSTEQPEFRGAERDRRSQLDRDSFTGESELRRSRIYGGGGPEEDADELDRLLDELANEAELDSELDAEVADDEADELMEDLGADGDVAADEIAEDDDGGRDRRRSVAEELGLEDDEPVAPRSRPARRERGGGVEALNRSASVREQEANELARLAGEAIQRFELQKARSYLRDAERLSPNNEAVQRLKAELAVLMGDVGARPQAAVDIIRMQQIATEQAVVEVQQRVINAERLTDEKKYAQAIAEYERAQRVIQNFPYHLGLTDRERNISTRLTELRRRKQEQDARERQLLQDQIRNDLEGERRTDAQLVRARVGELQRKAEGAEAANDYERAIKLYEAILALNPQDRDSRTALNRVREMRHRFRLDELRQLADQNYDRAVVGIEESSIVYQQIFRYPDREEWIRLAPKDLTLAEQIEASESEHEREIKRKLAEPVGDVIIDDQLPVSEVLRNLREISGLNFVLTNEGAEVENAQIAGAEYSNLPLENVLSLILRAIGAVDGKPYAYAIKDGAVVIGPRESLKLPEYLIFYDISDLVSRRPDYKAPPLALDELAGKSAGAEGGGILPEEDDVGDDPIGGERLLELIQRELAGDGEEEEDQSGIALFGAKLSARTTLENHLKLAQLLEQFRKSIGVMVTVESRFLDIQDNFLEEIGVDFGSGGNTFLPNTIPDVDGAGTSVSPGYEYVNPQGDYNARVASIGQLSTPLGSAVNPFNLSAEGGGAYQLNVLKAERFQLEAILTGVAKEQEIRKLNSPRVTAFNGQTSHTLVVNQSAYIQDLEVNQTGVIPVINPVIGVLNSGSILEVRPTLSYDRKYVVLEIQPTLAEQLESDVAILNLSGNFTVVPVELPVLSVTKIKTTVTVPDGGTVLVGGLKREISTKTSIGIPGLLDIPVANLLFGRKGQSTLRSNLFVLLNAKVTVVHEEEARLFGDLQ